MKRALSIVLLLALLCCTRQEPAPVAAPKEQRIVVMAPSAAETLELLGAADRIVGRGDFVQWPPRMQQLPRVGAYHSPNVESVISLGTTLLITTSSQAGQGAHAKLRELGVDVLELKTSNYEGMVRSILRIGEAVRREEAAREIVTRIRSEMDEIRALGAGAPKRRVVLVVDRDPIYVAGPGSHVDEMIRAVGGENIAADAASDWQLLSAETILERAPEVIIDTSDNGQDALRGRRPGPWGRWNFLPAVAQNRVYWVAPARLVIPGPRIPQMTRLMGKIIHPEIFGEPAPEEYQMMEAPAGAASE